MTENKQTTAQPRSLTPLPIAFGALVVGALFLPWVSFFTTISGIELLYDGSRVGFQNSWMIAIPATVGITAIFVSMKRAEPRIYGIPAIGVFVVVLYKLFSVGSKFGINLSDIDDILEIFTDVFGIGVLLTVLGLLGLSVVSFRCRKNLVEASAFHKKDPIETSTSETDSVQSTEEQQAVPIKAAVPKDVPIKTTEKKRVIKPIDNSEHRCPHCHISFETSEALFQHVIDSPACRDLASLATNTVHNETENDFYENSYEEVSSGTKSATKNITPRTTKIVIGALILVVVCLSAIILYLCWNRVSANNSDVKNALLNIRTMVSGKFGKKSDQTVSGITIVRTTYYSSTKRKNITPTLTTLDVDAAKAAEEYLKPTRSGESCYLCLIEENANRKSFFDNTPNGGKAVIELQQPIFSVYSSEISDADRLNGIEWRGTVRLQAKVGRSFRPKHRFHPDTTWTNWSNSPSLSVSVVKSNGRWHAHISDISCHPVLSTLSSIAVQRFREVDQSSDFPH